MNNLIYIRLSSVPLFFFFALECPQSLGSKILNCSIASHTILCTTSYRYFKFLWKELHLYVLLLRLDLGHLVTSVVEFLLSVPCIYQWAYHLEILSRYRHCQQDTEQTVWCSTPAMRTWNVIF